MRVSEERDREGGRQEREEEEEKKKKKMKKEKVKGLKPREEVDRWRNGECFGSGVVMCSREGYCLSE